MSSSKKGRKNFTSEEIYTLIQVWGSEKVQMKFEQAQRHTFIWQNVAKQMEELGYVRTADECKNKISNLKAEFYAKKRALRSGSEPPTWDFWDALNDILGKRDLCNDSLVHDTLDNDSLLDSAEVAENFEDLDSSPIPSGAAFGSSSSEFHSDLSIEDSTASTSSQEPGNVKTFKKITRASKRKNTSEDSLLQKLIDNDNKYLQLQEKRQDRDALLCTAAINFFNSFTSMMQNPQNVQTFSSSTLTATASPTPVQVGLQPANFMSKAVPSRPTITPVQVGLQPANFMSKVVPSRPTITPVQVGLQPANFMSKAFPSRPTFRPVQVGLQPDSRMSKAVPSRPTIIPVQVGLQLDSRTSKAFPSRPTFTPVQVGLQPDSRMSKAFPSRPITPVQAGLQLTKPVPNVTAIPTPNSHPNIPSNVQSFQKNKVIIIKKV